MGEPPLRARRILIVGEYFNRQAVEFSAAGSRLGVFASSNGLGRFNGLAFDNVGNLNVAGVQTNNVRRFCTSGIDVGNFVTSGLGSPLDVAFDAAGNLYVLNGANGAILRFRSDGTPLGQFATVSGGNSMTFDALGYLYITSYTTDTVKRISPLGVNLGNFCTISGPAGLAFDSTGNLYVASITHNTIRKFSLTGQDLGVFASGSGINDPRGIAFDSSNRLYVCNYGNGSGSTVRRFSSTGADLGNFATGLFAPTDLAFRPVPPPPVTISGRVELEDCASTLDVPISFSFRPNDGCPSLTLTVVPDVNGNFAIPNVPRAVYYVSAKGSKWLRQTMLVNTTFGDVDSMTFFLLAGDANGDNAIDGLDLSIFIRAFDSSPDEGAWNPRADFNCDNIVDVYDLDIFIRNFDAVGDD